MADFMPRQHIDSATREPTLSSPDNAANVIQIPSSSFTAFRLLYATPIEISNLASTVFLGKVPDAWTKLSNKLTIFSKTIPLRPSARNWISSTATGVKTRLNKYTRFGVSGLENTESISGNARDTLVQQMTPHENWDGSSTESPSLAETGQFQDPEYLAISDHALSDNGILDGVFPGIVSDYHPQNVQDGKNAYYYDCDISSKDSDFDQSSNRASGIKLSRPSVLELNKNSKIGVNLSLGGKDLNPSKDDDCLTSERFFFDETEEYTSSSSGVFQGPESKSNLQSNTFTPNKISKPAETHTIQNLPQENIRPSLKGKTGEFFRGSDKSGSKKLKVQFANPHPEEQLSTDHLKKEYIVAEREHYRTIRKMQSLAHKSKGKARLSTSKLKLKVIDNIFRRGKAGDIIRVDKMLVMIKRDHGISSVPKFAERNNLNTLIQDHWREYYVVLRKTGDSLDSLRIQFFDSNKGKHFEGKPEHYLDLSKTTKADLFSHTDKTISIADLVDDGLRIFTMNAKYTIVAYRWLYMIKEVLDDDFLSTLKINLAGASVQIRINIPNGVLKKVFSGSNFMTLKQQSTGYTIETDVLFTYLRSKIDSHLRQIVNRHGEANGWMKRNPNPGFCFKFYDRIEWIPNDGKSLMVQSQLLRDEAILEYRQVTKLPLSIENSKGKSLSRPLQIEGYLSRITNTSGKEVSKFRAFYKMQYFFSSENLLFFSSFFRGIPPSPHNELLKDGVDRQSLCNLLPDIYLRNPFEMDANERISWLQDTEFEKFDNEAVEEFSRKLQQIVSARAVVDLSMISAVRPISFDTIQKRHLYYQLYLWYSSPKILEDMSIIDSGFEIELFNGKYIKLLAPLRVIRDEWVERLNVLAVYWKSQISHLMREETFTKLNNMSNLRLDDYVDSNLSFGPDSLEIKKSIANFNAFTTSGLAMSTCILCSGYLYQKQKKHSNFSRYFVVLCPGYLLIFSLFKRSKVTGVWKDTPYFERYMTIPISECYVYSGASTQLDLVGSQKVKSPGECDLPRVYPDGWRSSEEEFMRCFSIWFGGKRVLRHGVRYLGLDSVQGSSAPKNPGMVRMACKLGVTGKILVFLARSRQEREHWVYNILQEINRFSGD